MFGVKETIAQGVCIKASMRLNAEPTHENVLRGTELIKLLKISYKSLFNQKLLSIFL
jgi:hypothetical protein